MRKILILAGVVLGGALFAGAPAKAELGCVCVKLGTAAACTSGVSACTLKAGGACVLPCDYTPAKAVAKKKAKAKAKKTM